MTNLVLYQRPAGSGDAKWYAKGREPRDGTSTPSNGSFPDRYVEGAEPWRLKPGESHMDNIPAGVPIVTASSISSSTEVYTLFSSIENTLTESSYIQLDATVYTMNSFHEYSTNYFQGYANAKRRIMGIIGAPRTYDQSGNVMAETVIRVMPSATTNTPGARDYVLNATSSMRTTALFFDNSTTSVPLFISGITFQGTLQTPYSVYSSAAQAVFRINNNAASPLAWNGISIWYAVAGSRFQFCRFQGFGFALNTMPPFECGCVNSNRCNGLVIYRNEMDGRIAKSLDSSQPRSSGGWMFNKESKITIQDSWQHHTRRSGWATNTNTRNESEQYIGNNFQCEEIANNPNDGWAGDNGYFNGSNVEAVVGTFTYTNFRVSVASGSHISWAMPYSGSEGVYSSPTHAVIKVRGFRTDDTLYGGCFRIGVNKNPNSTGISPVWVKLNDIGIEASGLFDIRNENNMSLIGVHHTDYNSQIHKPETHYIVKY